MGGILRKEIAELKRKEASFTPAPRASSSPPRASLNGCGLEGLNPVDTLALLFNKNAESLGCSIPKFPDAHSNTRGSLGKVRDQAQRNLNRTREIVDKSDRLNIRSRDFANAAGRLCEREQNKSRFWPF